MGKGKKIFNDKLLHLLPPSQSSLLAESKNSSGHELSERMKNQTKCKISENLFDGSRNAELKNLTIFCTTTSPSTSPHCFLLVSFDSFIVTFTIKLILVFLFHAQSQCQGQSLTQCHLIPTPSTDIDQHCIIRAKTSEEDDNIQSKFWNLK